MIVFSNGHGEVLIRMSYPEFELLQTIIDMSANGAGCHRGAEYVNHKLAMATQGGAIEEAISEVARQDEKDEAKKIRKNRRKVE